MGVDKIESAVRSVPVSFQPKAAIDRDVFCRSAALQNSLWNLGIHWRMKVELESLEAPVNETGHPTDFRYAIDPADYSVALRDYYI